jgi:hypothetical protein
MDGCDDDPPAIALALKGDGEIEPGRAVGKVRGILLCGDRIII